MKPPLQKRAQARNKNSGVRHVSDTFFTDYINPIHLSKINAINIFDVIDSTNTYLLSKKNLKGINVCVAESQTQGRGRQGKVWHSPPGTNIYCSVHWPFKKKIPFSGLSLSVGVMIANALKTYGIPPLQLKWPNDILHANKKLGGILLESNQPNSVVIGFGLNINLGDDAKKEWTDLATIAEKNISKNKLLGMILNELFINLPVFENKGLMHFKKDWQQYDFLFCREVTLTSAKNNVHGIMTGINNDGELLLQLPNGAIQSFSLGEVSVRCTTSSINE
jgi:BirA family biotin operon repressor/biotin-[acetyl-CoA-carboxylase] ligase